MIPSQGAKTFHTPFPIVLSVNDGRFWAESAVRARCPVLNHSLHHGREDFATSNTYSFHWDMYLVLAEKPRSGALSNIIRDFILFRNDALVGKGEAQHPPLAAKDILKTPLMPLIFT
jgi:hypothetical protein